MADEHAVLVKELEDQLVEQRQSLTEIKNALLEEPENEELRLAKKELQDAVQSLEESLLGLKKYQLLSQIDNHFQSAVAAVVSPAPEHAAPATSPPTSGDVCSQWEVGHLCQFRHWDGRWHVGKIKEIDHLPPGSYDAELEAGGTAKGGGVATIWFYAPLRQSHVSCRFLERFGACKFGDSCRMCHGVQVPLASLHRYTPLDPLRMPLGTKVLACYPPAPLPGDREEVGSGTSTSARVRGDSGSGSSNTVAGLWKEAEIRAYGGSIRSPPSAGGSSSNPSGSKVPGGSSQGPRFVQVVFLSDGHKAALRCDQVIPLGDGPCVVPQAGRGGGGGGDGGPAGADTSSESESASGYESSDERELLSGDEDELAESEGMGLMGVGVGTLVLPSGGLASVTTGSEDGSASTHGVAPPGVGPAWHGRRFALWEAHTRGIGSRLLASMGYVEGKGLGRDSQGIVAPLQVRVLPSRRSLDFCNLSKDAGAPTGPPRKKRRRGGERSRRKKEAALARHAQLLDSEKRGNSHGDGFGPATGARDGADANVFDVINRRIHKRWSDADDDSNASALSGAPASTLDGNTGEGSTHGSRGSGGHQGRSKGKPPMSGPTTGSGKLNRVALMGMSDKVAASRERIQRLVEMEQRNKNDPVVGAAVRHKLEQARKDLSALENAHASAQNEVHKKESQKKWLKF
eukprot:jgi/Mesvir1/28303/Mv04824-RA.2